VNQQPIFIRVAVATESNEGLEGIVSQEFGHAETFTILDIENGIVKSLNVIQNPAKHLAHGKGPVIAKHLANMNVNIVISGEIGPGASMVLSEFKIKKIIAKPGQHVLKVLKNNSLIIE